MLDVRLTADGPLPGQDWYWWQVERSFGKLNGELDARRSVSNGIAHWALSPQSGDDADSSERGFRLCARNAARIYQRYRTRADETVDLVDLWLDIVASEEGDLAGDGRGPATVITAAVDASKRAAARLRAGSPAVAASV